MATAAFQSSHTFEIVEVPSYGDSIEAARDTRDGTAYVSIRRVCENLGIAFQPQIEKLNSYHWATVTKIVAVAQDGKQRELTFLPLAQVPVGLTHINPDKIGAGPEQIEKLKRYQIEAVDVLYKHFVAPRSQDPILAMLEACRAQRQAQLVLEDRVDVIQQQVGNLVELRTAALRVLYDVPRTEEPPAPLPAAWVPNPPGSRR